MISFTKLINSILWVVITVFIEFILDIDTCITATHGHLEVNKST